MDALFINCLSVQGIKSCQWLKTSANQEISHPSEFTCSEILTFPNFCEKCDGRWSARSPYSQLWSHLAANGGMILEISQAFQCCVSGLSHGCLMLGPSSSHVDSKSFIWRSNSLELHGLLHAELFGQATTILFNCNQFHLYAARCMSRCKDPTKRGTGHTSVQGLTWRNHNPRFQGPICHESFGSKL